MTQKKRVVISGAAGFIGSHLVDAFLQHGHEVVGVDNLITGREHNLAEAKKFPSFTFIRHDVTQPLHVNGTVDYVFHLASPASVIDYQKYPFETCHVNSRGTEVLLELAKNHTAIFLFTSTSEVYGDPLEHPQKETYWGNVNPNGVRACYDESKRFGEMITLLYQRNYNVDTRIIRIFNTYGPRMRPTDGRVISNFVNQAIKDEDLTVNGDGNQTRSFCYVSDLVDGLYKAGTLPHLSGEVINLGNPEEYKTIDLARRIKEMCSSSSQIRYMPLPPDDPKLRRPDITKAQKLLDWQPTISLEAGLARTIEYYKSITE